jgi:hypothetical protein
VELLVKNTQYIGLVIACLIGSFLGGAVMPSASPAHAQSQVVFGSGQRQQVIQEDIRVAAQGLRFVDPQGRPIAIIGSNNGNGGFVLFDAAGNPSIVLQSGADSQVTVRGVNSGRLDVLAQTGRASTLVARSSTEITMATGRNPGVRLATVGAKSSLALAANDLPVTAELTADNLGGGFSLRKSDNFVWLTTLLGGEAWALQLSDAKNQSRTRLEAKGNLVFIDREGKTSQWPPKEEGK